MINLRHARINTAGAYICINEYYLFAIGIQLHNGQIPVVRLGGHREGHETGWQCAVREVYEETSLLIEPLFPQATYVSDWDQVEHCIRCKASFGAVRSTSAAIKEVDLKIRKQSYSNVVTPKSGTACVKSMWWEVK